MALKTLHLTNSWHETSGGIAAFYRALMQEANHRGHQMRLVVPGETDRIQEIGEFAKIYHVKANRAPLNSQYRMISPGQFLPAESALQKIVLAERPDLVEICDKYTLTYFGALLRRGLLKDLNFRPVVIGLSCERMDDNFRSYIRRMPFARPFCAAYMKWLYFPFFDHHIANSAYTAEELRVASRGHLVRRDIWVLPMGVNTRNFSPERRSQESRKNLLRACAGSEQSVLLCYAGRLAPEKNLPQLFRTFERLVHNEGRDYRLLVAGDGIERKHWEAFCERAVPGRAKFTGYLKDRDALADFLANADAFIHPNPREPFGIAPLEAMASGLPLVAPDSGGVTSYATRNNAWIGPANEETFAALIEELVSDPDERARRAANALRVAAEYQWDNIAPSFLDLYSELHFAADKGTKVTRGAAFSSTPMEGARVAFFRGFSRTAEKAFIVASSLLSHQRRIGKWTRY